MKLTSAKAETVRGSEMSNRAEDALRESEARFQALCAAAPIGIYQADAQGRTLYTNARWQAMSGITEEESLGCGWSRAVHPEDRERVVAEWSEATREGRELSTECRLLTPQGEVRWVHGRAAALVSPEGQLTGYVGTVEDITERKSLQALSHRLVELQESERRQIARELHDEVGQLLTRLDLLLQLMTRLPAARIRDRLGEAQTLVSELTSRVRELSLDLRPAMLDDLGLLPALLWHCERYSAQTGVQVSLEHAGLERRFQPEVETAAYRIVQEALTNVARHAGVGEVTVRLWANEDMMGVQIEDHGSGFDPTAALASGVSSGLVGMRERATLAGGQLVLESAPGRGACLMAEFPLGVQELEKAEAR